MRLTMNKTMKFIDIAQFGTPEVLKLQEGSLPIAQAGEVLIKIIAAGVNRPDVVQRQGLYPAPPGASPILGLEVSGVIEALGEGVTQWQVGDKICALTIRALRDAGLASAVTNAQGGYDTTSGGDLTAPMAIFAAVKVGDQYVAGTQVAVPLFESADHEPVNFRMLTSLQLPRS